MCKALERELSAGRQVLLVLPTSVRLIAAKDIGQYADDLLQPVVTPACHLAKASNSYARWLRGRQELTTEELMDAAGVGRDKLLGWLRSGALRARRTPGPGNVGGNRYSPEDGFVAAVLGAMSRAGLASGRAVDVGQAIYGLMGQPAAEPVSV